MASDSASLAKVVIHLKSVGDAPVLRQQKFQVSGSDKFARVIEFLRRQLKKETLFVYVNSSSFLPNPDELVSDLYNAAFPNDVHKCVICFRRLSSYQKCRRQLVIRLYEVGNKAV